MSDAIADILDSCRAVVRRATRVQVDDQALERFAEELCRLPGDDPVGDGGDLIYRGGRCDICNYCLLCDALNFCFWSDEPWEVTFRGRLFTRTPAMEASLLKAIDQDQTWLDASRWAKVTQPELERVFGGRGMIPLLPQRVRVMRETGRVLLERFEGRFQNAVLSIDGDAVALSRLLATEFPSFRDIALHAGEQVAILKRAQICAADLHRTLLANDLSGLTNLDGLTVFADYRLPQLFRDRGVLVLDAESANRIERGEFIEAGSAVEVELRAATVVIGDELVRAMRVKGIDAAAWSLDYRLWLMARHPDVTVSHHRTVTVFY